MEKLHEAVAKYICLAQASSDAGKNIYNPIQEFSGWEKALCEQGYINKTHFILKAIDLINRSKDSGFCYYCEIKPDQNGWSSIITYFSFRLYGERKQISFHTPYSMGHSLLPYCKQKKVRMHWAKHQSSAINAVELWIALDL